MPTLQPTQLKFVNTNEHINVLADRLPHWNQSCCVQFVTFRLADSLPQTKLQEFTDNKRVWLEHHPKPWDEATQEEYDSFANAMEKWIDAGYGSCVLSERQIRNVVIETLMHYDSEHYYLHAFVIMPNHVHVLLTPNREVLVQDIVKTWKTFSARQINRLTNKKGSLWESSCFDHMIRNADEYRKKLEYIIANPRNLPHGSYTLFVR